LVEWINWLHIVVTVEQKRRAVGIAPLCIHNWMPIGWDTLNRWHPNGTKVLYEPVCRMCDIITMFWQRADAWIPQKRRKLLDKALVR
jgi:hypothetical protein